MGKKQAELPGTRRDDEPEPPKPIKALDDACEMLEKARGKATKAGQGVVEAKSVVDKLLREHGITEYVYETSTGVEKKAFISEGVKTAKIKKATKGDDDGADE
jgi:thiamine pyrophosphate-dependent acetolactate synthase large subunit-like protein